VGIWFYVGMAEGRCLSEREEKADIQKPKKQVGSGF
jgi:hypothetical protein